MKGTHTRARTASLGGENCLALSGWESASNPHVVHVPVFPFLFLSVRHSFSPRGCGWQRVCVCVCVRIVEIGREGEGGKEKGVKWGGGGGEASVCVCV